jgi:hypothetical protein
VICTQPYICCFMHLQWLQAFIQLETLYSLGLLEVHLTRTIRLSYNRESVKTFISAGCVDLTLILSYMLREGRSKFHRHLKIAELKSLHNVVSQLLYLIVCNGSTY